MPSRILPTCDVHTLYWKPTFRYCIHLTLEQQEIELHRSTYTGFFSVTNDVVLYNQWLGESIDMEEQRADYKLYWGFLRVAPLTPALLRVENQIIFFYTPPKVHIHFPYSVGPEVTILKSLACLMSEGEFGHSKNSYHCICFS